MKNDIKDKNNDIFISASLAPLIRQVDTWFIDLGAT